MVIIINLEDRWLQLYKQRTDMIVTRRQEDVKDQCMEYSTGLFYLKTLVKKFRWNFLAKAQAFVNGTLTTNDFRTPLDQKRQRRATEREARRYFKFIKIKINIYSFLFKFTKTKRS